MQAVDAAFAPEVWSDHKENLEESIWKHKNKSFVPYQIDGDVTKELKSLIYEAINEFDTKTPVKWIPYNEDEHIDYVTFIQNNERKPYASHIGRDYESGEHTVSLPHPYYPSSKSRLRLICVLHEMMHILGFHHEMLREDAKYHCTSNEHAKKSTAEPVSFGAYDYLSVMQYANGVGYQANNDEYKAKADHGKTFSQGDLAAIRRLYEKGSRPHFGEWHRACGKNCTKTSCSCGACGPLPGGVNCGYTGTKGHWSCCMKENYGNKRCNETHTGFWHMACTGKRCTNKTCYCKSCGGGCKYEGSKAHWSCCNGESWYGKCKKSPY